MKTNIDELLKLPIDEKLEIVDKIWESIDGNASVDEDELRVVMERYEEYKRNPQDSLSWSEVKAKLFSKYGLAS